MLERIDQKLQKKKKKKTLTKFVTKIQLHLVQILLLFCQFEKARKYLPPSPFAH